MTLHSLDKSVSKILRRRRFRFGIVLIFALALLVYSGRLLWRHFHEPAFVAAEYALDSESPTYWRDRSLADIESWPRGESTARRERFVHLRLDATIHAAQHLRSDYERIMAISDIALTLAENDEKYNINSSLRDLGTSPLAQSRLARVFVSQALMNLRAGDTASARVAIQEYHRLVNEADLKLDSDVNVLAFVGAVTALAVLDDLALLAEMFQQQSNFTLRIVAPAQPKAYRILAGEQARMDLVPHALNSAHEIENPVELIRACQLIISRVARPEKIEPIEPGFPRLPDAQRRPPLAAPTVVRSVVDQVLGLIAKNDEYDTQINLLLRLAGSQLMCDPEIHAVFVAAVEQSDFDELVSRPVLQLLREPESDAIRAALGMTPAQRTQRRNVDPALDDWSSAEAPIAVDLIDIAPETLKSLNAVQMLRAQNRTARSFLIVSRYRDAAQVLKQAIPVAKALADPQDRSSWLLSLGETQLSAGDAEAALGTFQAVEYPHLTQDEHSTLARLQVLGRFYEEARQTIDGIASESQRNADLAFLATEQIRVRQFENAQKTVAKMGPTPQKDTLRHVLALGLSEKGDETQNEAVRAAEHFAALNVPDPHDLVDDAELSRCSDLLLQRGLYEWAATAAEKIQEPARRFTLLHRIARENMLLFRSHRLNVALHKQIRVPLFEMACRLADKIDDAARRATLRDSILADAFPYMQDDNMRPVLVNLQEQTLQDCRSIPDTEPTKAELLANMLLKKMDLEPSGTFESFEPLVKEILSSINQTNAGRRRGTAQSRLAAALIRLGKGQMAQQMIGEARHAVRSDAPYRDSVTVLLSLIPSLKTLGDAAAARAVYDEALMMISETYADAPTAADKDFQWRLRDSELDRLVRSQLELGYLDLALEFSSRINENLIRERLLRALAYISLDQGDLALAEYTIQLTKRPDINTNALRDVQFMKRQRGRQ